MGNLGFFHKPISGVIGAPTYVKRKGGPRWMVTYNLQSSLERSNPKSFPSHFWLAFQSNFSHSIGSPPNEMHKLLGNHRWNSCNVYILCVVGVKSFIPTPQSINTNAWPDMNQTTNSSLKTRNDITWFFLAANNDSDKLQIPRLGFPSWMGKQI